MIQTKEMFGKQAGSDLEIWDVYEKIIGEMQ